MSNTSIHRTTFVPRVECCRVCNAVQALLRKAERLETIAAGYTDQLVRAELRARAMRDRATAAAITCNSHGKAA